jgi:hypothetical protein
MGGSVNRSEPSNIEDIKANPTVMEIFEQAGWLGFLEQFQGSDNKLAMKFAQTFDGYQTMVKRLNITVSKESISQITHLARQGERWYKNFRIAAESRSPYLKEPSPLPDLRRGIHRDALSPPWNEVVFCL